MSLFSNSQILNELSTDKSNKFLKIIEKISDTINDEIKQIINDCDETIVEENKTTILNSHNINSEDDLFNIPSPFDVIICDNKIIYIKDEKCFSGFSEKTPNATFVDTYIYKKFIIIVNKYWDDGIKTKGCLLYHDIPIYALRIIKLTSRTKDHFQSYCGGKYYLSNSIIQLSCSVRDYYNKLIKSLSNQNNQTNQTKQTKQTNQNTLEFVKKYDEECNYSIELKKDEFDKKCEEELNKIKDLENNLHKKKDEFDKKCEEELNKITDLVNILRKKKDEFDKKCEEELNRIISLRNNLQEKNDKLNKLIEEK